MEKHMHICTAVEVDYDDVFGGPPRFSSLIVAPHSGTSPSAMLDKVTARASSFRTSSLPVFDLPVFGDDASAGSIYYDSRANSKLYDDMFDEEGPLPDTFSTTNLYCGSRSKPSSRSSSRRMSPVHPVFASAGQSGGDDRLVAKTRPAVGRLSKRGSLSSTSSFDESGGKLADTFHLGTMNDSFSSSLPSSPPRSGSFGHLKSLSGATDDINKEAPQSVPEADDVFGGYPQRSYTQLFSAVPHNSIGVTDTSESRGAKTVSSEKPGLKIFSMSETLETSDTIEIALSRSSSIKHGREQREKQVWMSRRTNSSVSERSDLAAVKTSITSHDASFSHQSSFDVLQSLAPPVTPLRYKTWKDLVSDPSAGHTSTSRPVHNLAKTRSFELPMKEVAMDDDVVDVFVENKVNWQAQKDTEKPCDSSAAAQIGKVKSTDYTVEMEEMELQALLMNVWKVNEQVEREKYNAKFPVDSAKQTTRQNNSIRTQQYEHVDVDEKDSDINWKEWRKFGRGERRQVSSNDSYTDKASVGLKADKDAATIWDTAEVIRGGTDEVKVRVLPDGLSGLDPKKIFSKVVIEGQKSAEYIVKGQMQGRADDLNKRASFKKLPVRPSQEFVNDGEQNRASMTAQMEDTDYFIASTVGFEEVEGETSDRRKLRWERHVRARKRAEKALEEMQQRDAELQRQEKQKVQFLESSDEKIKRWAAGKEGNLRALLSNLQHVLWLECGWQPIPLSDLIEVPDVRKAYRKATLFVHPDKMQQKGATMQQKYIAERVFDILQAAWKTFSLQESL